MKRNKKLIIECPHYYRVLRREVTDNHNGTCTDRYEIECILCGQHEYESRTTEIYSEVKYKEIEL